MNDCAGRKSECPQRHRQCHVQSCRTGRVPEPKSFVADVSRVRHGADYQAARRHSFTESVGIANVMPTNAYTAPTSTTTRTHDCRLDAPMCGIMWACICANAITI